MSDRLAELLVNEGAVTTADLEQALARQQMAGGALDTALLELNLLSEERLLTLLADASELPPAPPLAWKTIDPRARRVFPSKVAERHGLVPFALDGRELSLVAAYPVDSSLLDELGFMLSLHLQPYVAPEWRVRELVHRTYGTPFPERLEKLAQRLGSSSTPPLDELEVDGEPEDLGSPEPTDSLQPAYQPAAPPTSAEPPESVEPLAAALAQAVEAAGIPVAPPPEAPPPPPAELDRSAPPRWTLEEAQAAVASAHGRDELVTTALRYARDFFEYAALFAVTYDAVAGHDALSAIDEAARDQCRMTAVSLSEPGLFGPVLEARAPYLGPPPQEAGCEGMLRALGREPPRTVLLYPVSLRGRIVCILYADNGEAPVSPQRLCDLLILLATVGSAFERILRERKRAKPAKPVAPQPPPLEPWQAQEPALATEDESLDEFDIDLGDYQVTPAAEAFAIPHTFDPAVAVLDLEASVRGSAERGRLIALLTLHAADSAPFLCARFPGPLEVKSEALSEITPIFEQGPILAALAALGTVATPYLIPLLTDAGPERRLCALRLCRHLADPTSFLALADRVFDPDPRVAATARVGLKELRRHPDMRAIVEKLRRALVSPITDRAVKAAQALGGMRDIGAIPLLVERLETDPLVADAALDALWQITLQRFGASSQRWNEWWKEHQATTRASWLFEALVGEDREARQVAVEELRSVGAPPVSYAIDAPWAERDQATRIWAAWWEKAGLTI